LHLANQCQQRYHEATAFRVAFVLGFFFPDATLELTVNESALSEDTQPERIWPMFDEARCF
jgi:hypothetical protein